MSGTSHTQGNFLSHWNRVAKTTKPVIAAVNGFAVWMIMMMMMMMMMMIMMMMMYGLG
jgi:enoyl-CoA hydratase/carnithine racemase